MSRTKDTKKMLKKLARSMPDIPYLSRPSRSSMIMPFVLGAIGVAIVGGLAAVMIFSPRTRYKTIGTAKDVYGKAKGELDSLGVGRHRHAEPLSNGLSGT